MPPKRQKKAVDILDKVLDTASLPHSVDIVSLKQQIEEQLRILSVRAPLKQLGKGDSVESRKLVLLQHILRASNHDVTLKTQKLASAVGMKNAAFEQLSSRLAHYRIDKSSTKKRKRTRSASSQGALQSRDGGTITKATSTIPALSIRLGSQVHDSHGFAQRAQQLLKDMEQHIRSTSTISSQKKKGYLQDMQRSRQAYEAACFYLVARGRKMKKTSRGGDGASQEEEDNTQLSIQDVVEASSSVSMSEFRGILPTVEKFASDIENGAKKPAASRKQPVSAGGPSKRRRGKSPKNSQEQEKTAMDGATRAVLEGVEAAASGGTETQSLSLAKTTPSFVYSPRFLQWKERVLQETRNSTKEIMSKEEGKDRQRVSDFEAMQRAADEVLHRIGLAPTESS